MDIAHSGGTLLASFLASMVECVEALTIILAVGIVRGWRPALIGAGLALILLAVLVAILGPSLSLIPLTYLQIAIGLLLVMFGMRWLRKAMLRAAGIVAVHDEAVAFSAQTSTLSNASAISGWDLIGLATSFKAVMLEGIEVVFIVIALGTVGNALTPASVGAIAAAILVSLIGLMLHRPLARVPENTLKFVVGIMLSAFGTYWLGEGYGLWWPGADLALLGLIAGFAVTSLLGIWLIRHATNPAALPT